ncbi:hypothetical protein AAL09_00475 [Salmonella enterica subsp. enterica serovar Newport]|uniref:Uncharacterized protein n=3 Tax=Salmonella enterica TaxID=28901 RepID=A0A5H6XYM2_SALET|nr:hypothetical protein [Salmonella enterica]EAA4489414.1 hypothetical protein [Salmonella enterica subsp. enterica]EAA7501336.1 hypothetical protein [Salmonella enterica subsp. enterica serovar Thompson]EBQ9454215.1 hypothetical protein [Salmonella enterica subsp. enterica serovar Newport]EBS3902604.1 hypothetical protein [Salmonella enterica subsp. enterica serovar Heidelberg]EBW2996375.1 hypothetical protein [Salmonella enterica subsp. enterica serovar Stanley]ECK9478686.1 hypothetical pro
MDESRKQFLEWFGEEFESINNSEELHVQAIKMIAWQSWVKSRAAIEIKLDDKVMVEDEFDAGHNCAIDYCAESIRAAGIKVKG